MSDREIAKQHQPREAASADDVLSTLGGKLLATGTTSEVRDMRNINSSDSASLPTLTISDTANSSGPSYPSDGNNASQPSIADQTKHAPRAGRRDRDD